MLTRLRPTACRVAALTLATILPLALPPSAGAQEEPSDPALEQYYVANAAYNRKLYPVAVSQFEGFLKAHPEHAKADLARRGLALSQYALKQYEKAMPHFSALLEKEQLDEAISRDRLVMLQGQCLLLTGSKDAARELFVAEIDRLQSEEFKAAARAAICDVSFGNGAWEEVLAWTGKLLSGPTDANQTARGLYQQGYAHYQLQDPEASIASLGKIAALEADDLWETRASYLLGECHNRLRQYEQAEAGFAAALPGLSGADRLECRYRLGMTRFIQEKYPEARADLEAYLAGSENGRHSGSAQLYIARCRLEGGEFAEAQKQFEALSAGDGDIAARANLWWARVFTRQPDRDYDRAAEILGKACERFAESDVIDDLKFDYANALMGRETPDWAAALGLLQKLEQGGSFPQMAAVVGQLAVCQHKLKDYAGSLATNDRFLQSFADHRLAGDARFMRAENLFLLGRMEEAAAAYSTFLSTDASHPNRTAALYRVAQIHHDQKRWADCLAALAPLLEQKPTGQLYAQLPFMRGDCLFRQEKWEEAITPLEEFLSPRVETGENPNVTMDANVDTALMQLAVASDRVGNTGKALTHLALLVEQFGGPTPHLPLALAERGRLAYDSGDLALARQSLERFLAEDEKADPLFAQNAPAQRSRVLYYLGWVDAAEDKHESAATRFDEVVKLGDNPTLVPDAALQQGIALVNSGNFEAAARHFPAMLKSYPQHEKLPRVVYYAGLALARQKDWKNAAGHFKRVTESFPDSEFADQALYEWAWCARGLEDRNQAVKLYDELLAKHPESPLAIKVQSELAELNLESGEQDKVITRLTEALAKVKDEKLREDIRYQLATAHFKNGDHETAATRFEQLLEDYPQSKLRASMLFQAGESRLKLKETVSAREHFAAAAAIEGTAPALAESITMRLAETRALTEQHEEARKSYALFLERFPESRWTRNARFGLAFAMENGGDSEGAIEEYKKLLADKTVDLWTVRSRFQTGECYFNLQEYDRAVTEFVNVEISYKRYPAWQAKAILEIGRVLLAQGKNEEAAERFKEVIRRYGKENAATVAKQYLDELRSR